MTSHSLAAGINSILSCLVRRSGGRVEVSEIDMAMRQHDTFTITYYPMRRVYVVELEDDPATDCPPPALPCPPPLSIEHQA